MAQTDMNGRGKRMGARVTAPLPHPNQRQTLWVMRKITGRLATATIYRLEHASELRVCYGTTNDIINTVTSGVGEAPLLVEAAEVRQKLEALGWTPVEI